MRAIIDCKVLVPALLSRRCGRDSAPSQVLQAVIGGRMVPLWHWQLFIRYEQVLSRPRFAFTRQMVHMVLDIIQARGQAVNLSAGLHALRLSDAEDQLFYDLLLSASTPGHAAWLITGDRGFSHDDERIISPRQALELLDTA